MKMKIDPPGIADAREQQRKQAGESHAKYDTIAAIR